jgi:AraC family L-rhamnose operon regulatory protein RhaS
MAEIVQLYKEQGKIYHADTCVPLVQAREKGKLQLEAWGRYSYPGIPLSNEELQGINSIGYWDAQAQQDWGLDWHRNEGIEITFLENGSMPFLLGKDMYKLEPDEITITRPWQPHKVGDPNIGAGKLHWFILDVGVRQPHQEWKWPDWIILSPIDIAELTKMLRQNEQPAWKTNAAFRKCFQRLAAIIKNNQPAIDASWIKIFINELLMQLLTLFRSGTISLNEALTEGRRTVELFLIELQKTLAEPWTLETMAANCGLGVTRFVHYCRQITNMTPMHYLMYIRLTEAAVQLKQQPKHTITEIGYNCGFSSPEYFTTSFRKQYGCSPGQYRTMIIS